MKDKKGNKTNKYTLLRIYHYKLICYYNKHAVTSIITKSLKFSQSRKLRIKDAKGFLIKDLKITDLCYSRMQFMHK